MKNKLISLITLMCMLLSVGATLASCNTKDTTVSDPNSSTTYVNLDINPEFSMTVDGEGKVISVIGENEDAQVILYGEEGIEGEALDTAVQKILDLAVEMGFISEENKTVEALVSSTDDTVAASYLNAINTKISAVAEDTGLGITLSTEGAYTLLRELEAFKAANPDNEAIKKLTVSEYKMALSASENGDITLEAAIALDRDSMLNYLSSSYSKVETYHTAAYEAAKAQALAIYQKALNLALDSVYSAFYAQNMMSHPTTAHLGYLYQMYASGAHGFEAIIEAVGFIDMVADYEISEDRVNEIAAALGLSETETDKLKNSDGKITLESVKAYVDVYMKNLNDTAETEQLKADIEAALTATEAELALQLDTLVAAYRPQVESVVAQLEPILASVEAIFANPLISSVIPEEERTELLAAYNEALVMVNAMLEGEDISVEGLDEIVKKLQSGADTVLVKINNDLSDDEKAQIETMKKTMEDGLSASYAEFEASIDNAATASKAHLQSLKDKYLNKTAE